MSGRVRDSRAEISLYIQPLHLLRVYLIQIGLSYERGIFLRDMLDLWMRKNVSLDF